MQELEKVLEEMKESSIMVATSKEHYIHPQDRRFVEEVVLLNDVEEIIRKHLSRENGQEIMGIKIRDNETGEIFEYGTNIHHALRISKNGGCLTFENLQNGDGSSKSGDGGYSFVLNDGKTPEESSSPDSMYGATYANIGGFHEHLSRENAPEITRSSRDNDGWIPVEERLPEEEVSVLVQWEKYDKYLNVTLTYLDVMWLDDAEEKVFETINGVPNGKVIAWRPLPEPYRPEQTKEGERR